MIKTIWTAIERRKIVAIWHNDCIQSLRDWRKAVKSAYPNSHIIYNTVKLI